MFRTIGRWKVYLDRSRIYVGYVQYVAMILITLKVYEDTGVGRWFFATWWAIPAFIVVFFSVSFIVGYLDKRFIRPHEQREVTSTNPIQMEILRKVRKL